MPRNMTFVPPLPSFITEALPTEPAEIADARRADMAKRKAARYALRPQWRPMYASAYAMVPDYNSLLDADGKATKLKLARLFSHAPGDFLSSLGGKKTGAPPARYSVQPNHSLKRI